jgi:signal transduction histidine kinase
MTHAVRRMDREPLPTERTMLQGVSLARWGAWAWLTVTTLVQRDKLDHPVVAGLVIGGLLVWAIGANVLFHRRPGLLLHPLIAAGQLALSWMLLWLDGVVFDSGHTLSGGQNLAGTWPLIATLAASTALGPIGGAVGGALVGSGRIVGALANGESDLTGGRILSFLASCLFYAISGAVWGWVTRRLRVVETEVMAVRARDEVARTLHDGVLQTLALVERRTADSDPALASVARTSDRELRSWLYGGEATDRVGFDALVRRTVERIASGYDQQVTVNVLCDDEPPATIADALAAAIGEAVTNAAKHAGAATVVVFVESVPDEGRLFASVRDDGRGFDITSALAARRGIVRSINERLALVGGRAEVTSTPGKGTEVQMWVPA